MEGRWCGSTRRYGRSRSTSQPNFWYIFYAKIPVAAERSSCRMLYRNHESGGAFRCPIEINELIFFWFYK